MDSIPLSLQSIVWCVTPSESVREAFAALSAPAEISTPPLPLPLFRLFCSGRHAPMWPFCRPGVLASPARGSQLVRIPSPPFLPLSDF